MTGTSTRAHHPQRARVTGWKPSCVSPGEDHPRACPRTRPRALLSASDGRQYADTGAPLAATTSLICWPSAVSDDSDEETPGGTTNGPVVPRTAGPFAVNLTPGRVPMSDEGQAREQTPLDILRHSTTHVM